jgi:hypothetical protein
MSQTEIHPLAFECKEVAASAKSEVRRALRFWWQIANQIPASWNEVAGEKTIVF